MVPTPFWSAIFSFAVLLRVEPRRIRDLLFRNRRAKCRRGIVALESFGFSERRCVAIRDGAAIRVAIGDTALRIAVALFRTG